MLGTNYVFGYCRIASIESKSSHPMAAALVEYAQSKSIQPNPENVGDFRIYPGEGIYGEIHGKHIYIGNRRTLARASSPQSSEQNTSFVVVVQFLTIKLQN
jgi:Cd2+/Zn2+-exporting ATPase